MDKESKEFFSMDTVIFDEEPAEEDNDEVDLDLLEPEEVFEELFEKLNPLTIPAVVLGVILLIINFTKVLDGFPISKMVIGFVGGLSFVFGCSELIIFGVKGIAKKFNWSSYFMGIIAAIGADSSDIVVVSILLLRAKKLLATGDADNIVLGNELALTSITFLLTTVLINLLILGITMIVVSRKKPFKLPPELSSTESNLILGMAIFSFILITFGFTHNSIGIAEFDRVFQGVIGSALLLFYFMFILFLIGDTKQKRSSKIGPQVLISEYFPEEEELEKLPSAQKDQRKERFIQRVKKFFKKDNDQEEKEQYIALRRFPIYVLILTFTVGIAGIFFGGKMISESIEFALVQYKLPILLYSVIVGFVSTAPEMSITFRTIVKPEAEDTKIGLIHQVSSVNQTFFLLFGFPFLFASIVNIYIPVALDTTLVFTGIFAISLALHLMIIDDNQFDRVEGTLILIASIASLLSLAIIGGALH
ncbi:MAG: hypothetical protein ACTSXO_06755 [Candidatus Heimdallarchaeota archaeon]|nr:MAG: hypothetical protein DRO91_10120 [Candidatus Heimdallarchaeota archaeon]RLI69366.1 MAG: hypothetical protein DRO63_00985 [Candidatus Gerdarchaeota archaeon]